MDSVQIETSAPLSLEIPQIQVNSKSQTAKNSIRTSLRASTLDAVFSTVFSMTTGGILLSNFLVELDATPVVFGMLSSIPMLVNLIQPLGAYLSERTTSRFQYSFLIYGISRLLWLILVIGIAGASWGKFNSQQLVVLTLLIVLFSHLIGGLGSASWLSWLAVIVPRQLRGRYFGIRNSAITFTNLVYVPFAGLAVSHWPSGTQQGYGVVLLLGIVFGMVGLGCQYFKRDINPKLQNSHVVKLSPNSENALTPIANNSWVSSIWQNSNFLVFLLYFSLWMLAINLSGPFFSLYMLDTLQLDVSWVTVYSSLQGAANLLMMILWGKLADKIGNRPILIFIGIMVAITPLLWLGIGTSSLNLWLWLPLLHIFLGSIWAAIDLCHNNMLIGIAPVKNQSIYFAIVAAVAGASGALGTTLGGFIAQLPQFHGLLGLFALSSVFRLAALIPLAFVQEPQN
ncbi:MFS transporter [Cylindrospermum sp. FACHB-282]|uniref:MFS transporter n=1 Tax=Cylindrospermum sp. FACHB-282 TaxID=2692794 RepID=UPI0016835316|nr:MFS transporter [Cylindrospermum sp. FACHB-282]MBD2384074.1 MFS transporter [Cylindrospermum sp. FACHB-282]